MDFDEVKQLLKEAVNEAEASGDMFETGGDILRILVEKVYQKGRQDGRKDCCGNCEHSIQTDIHGLVICQRDDRTRDDEMICDKYERNLK